MCHWFLLRILMECWHHLCPALGAAGQSPGQLSQAHTFFISLPVPLAVCATDLCKGLSQVSHATLQRHLSQSPDLTELQNTTTRSQQRLLAFTPVVRQKPILSWNPVVESRTGFILGSGLLQLKASPGGSCGGECLPCGFGVFILQAKH